jgi:peptidoglycan/xylan/chitin deacetylase (PgdA/CDA1 family)
MDTHPISPLGPVKLAITMDDMLLFRGVPMPKGYSSVAIASAMTQALEHHGAKGVYAFSNTAPADEDPELLRVFDHWVEHGHHVANHTHYHASINWVEADTYIGDIERTEKIIARWAALAPQRCFRYCNDMWGDTAEKQATVGAYLARHGYTPVPVSVGFRDTRFHPAYWRTLKAGDREGVAFLRRAFVDTALHELRLHAENARAVFGRDPVHIWLIHGTPLGGDCLDEILDRFEAAGVQFVSLAEAMADPMNALVPPRVSPEFIHQPEKWALAHGIRVDDRPPPILEEIEKLHPAPGESAAEIRARQQALIAESLGARPAPFPLANNQQ